MNKPRRKIKKIIITVACALVLAWVVAGIGFYFLARYDAPAPDDSAFTAALVAVPPENNAIVTLGKLAGKVKYMSYQFPELGKSTAAYEDFNKFMAGERVDFETQALVMDGNREALAVLAEALKKPDVRFAAFRADDDATHALHAEFYHADNVARTTWLTERDGKRVFAWDDALDDFRFARRYGTAGNVSPFGFVIALTCQRNDATFLLKNIGSLEDRGMAIKVANVLSGDALAAADFKGTFRYQYALATEITRMAQNEAIVPNSARGSLRFRYMFRPNETRQLALDMLEAMSKAIDRGDPTLGPPPVVNYTRGFFLKRWFHGLQPNVIGRMALLETHAQADDVYQIALKEIARLRLAACAFALRGYWLDHDGKLPETLDELAPEYLKAVPVDIYGGGALRYDRERGVVSSSSPPPRRDRDAGEDADAQAKEPPHVSLDWSKGTVKQK